MSADEKISYSDLFDFSDSTSPDKAIKIIEALGKTYAQMADTLKASSKEAADSLIKIEEAAKRLKAEAKKNTNLDFLIKANSDAEKFLITHQKLSQQQKEYQAQIKKLEAEIARLEKSKKSIAKLNDAEAGSLAELKKQLKEAQAEYSKMGKASDDAAKANALDKVKALNKEYQDQAKILKEATSAKQALSNENNIEAGSLDDLKAKLKEAEAQYRKLAASAEESGKSEIVKQEQLNKIRELGKAVADGDKAIRDAKKGMDIAVGSYHALAKEVNDLNHDLKNLPDAFGKNRTEAERLQKVIYAKTQTLKDFDHAINTNWRSVGRYSDAMKGAGDIFKDALGIGSAVAIFSTISQGFKSAVDANREFEKSLSTLSSITGATGEDLEYYKQQAEEIGMTTTLSASQAVEAFKLMGSAAPELLKNRDALAATTKEAVILAEAAGLELPQATEALASTMAQFNLPAEEANRIINALAAGSKVGSAEIPDLTAAMDKAGRTASNFNVSVEESVALIEVMAKANIKGAEAGTQLRNVLLKMSTVEALPKEAQVQMEKFGVDLGIVSDKTIPVQDRLREMAKITGDATAMVKVFGTENINAADAILQQIDLFEEYNAGVTGTKTAMEQAAINVDNLDGDLKSLSSVMESLVLEGSVLNGVMRSMVQTSIEFLLAIKEAPKFIKENADIIGALVFAMATLNFTTVASTAATIKALVVKKSATIATHAQTAAQWLLNQAMTANPIGLVIKSVALLVAGFLVLYNRSENVRAAVTGITEVAKEMFAIIGEGLGHFMTAFNLIKNGEMGKAMVEIGKGLVKANPIGIAATQGKRLGKAYTDGVNKELGNIKTPKIDKGTGFYRDPNAVQKDDGEGYFREVKVENPTIPKTDEELAEEKKLAEERSKIAADQAKEAEENAKRIRTATREISKLRLQDEIEINKEIASNEEVNHLERLEAQRQVTEAKLKLNEIAKNAALDDKGLIKEEVELIEAEYKQAAEEIEKEMTTALDNIAKSAEAAAKKQIEVKNALAMGQVETNYKQQQLELEQALNEEEVTRKEFRERQLKAEEEFLKKKLALLEDQNAPESAILEAKLALVRKQNEIQLSEEKLKWEDYAQIGVNALNEVSNLTAALNARKAEEYQQDLTVLEEAKARELEIVGDNTEAQQAIEKQFAEKKKKLQDEEAKRKRKQAVFEKALAVSQTIINTAKAVMAFEGITPAAIAAGIMGAIKVATIIAQPIPQYYTGVEYAKEGEAWIGERGREIRIEPTGEATITPSRPTRTYLHEGTQIINHEETEKILSNSGKNNLPAGTRVDDLIQPVLNQNKEQSNTSITDKSYSDYLSSHLSRESIKDSKKEQSLDRKRDVEVSEGYSRTYSVDEIGNLVITPVKVDEAWTAKESIESSLQERVINNNTDSKTDSKEIKVSELSKSEIEKIKKEQVEKESIRGYYTGTKNVMQGWQAVESPSTKQESTPHTNTALQFIQLPGIEKNSNIEKKSNSFSNQTFSEVFLKSSESSMSERMHKSFEAGTKILEKHSNKPLTKEEVQQVFELNNQNLIREVKNLQEVIRSKPTQGININEEGFTTFIQNGQNRTMLRNKRKI